MTESRDRGTQPLDAILNELGFKNEVLVKASTEQLTHKMVARGRKGRVLTPNVQQKICNALNASQVEKQYSPQDLFNY